MEKRSTFSCGTIRKDRGKFPAAFDANLERGESLFMRTGNVMAVHWKDKKDVYCLSSIHGTKTLAVARKAGDEITKPEIITEYNTYMNGVNRCDQYIASYSFTRKTIKWWKKIFIRVFELATINAMILYHQKYPDKMKAYQSHKKFRIELIHQLVQPLLDQNAVRTPQSRPGRRPSAAGA